MLNRLRSWWSILRAIYRTPSYLRREVFRLFWMTERQSIPTGDDGLELVCLIFGPDSKYSSSAAILPLPDGRKPEYAATGVTASSLAATNHWFFHFGAITLLLVLTGCLDGLRDALMDEGPVRPDTLIVHDTVYVPQPCHWDCDLR